MVGEWGGVEKTIRHVRLVAPKALQAVMQANMAVSFGGSTLGRRREELIATSVSALNDCFY